ncbi:MAG: tRNA lysidine(34) synthetase TilS [Mediterranea sp.]|jgi:tRNA(Ile)-lysidine synthase|nr:tRNA lysidine(34) synthetase TilS [Mediterranea sp.]
MKYRIARYIEKEGLFTLRDNVLLALSGGADSVALLRILLSLGYTCGAAHCNFGLRGEESDADEAFVRRLCSEQGVPLHITRFDTRTYARKHKVSIEMAARELRYRWFDELARTCGYTVVAVAHHRDDSVETMLLNLIRGTGIRGLAGIHPRNGLVVRPLLCVGRDEVTAYLAGIGQAYVTDSSNLQDDYRRNRIRLKLLPLMHAINPSVKSRLFRTGNYLNSVAAVYDKAIKEGKARVWSEEGIHIGALLAEVSPGALLFEILHPLGFNSAQVEEILQATGSQPGKQFVSGLGWRVVRDRERILIRPAEREEDAPPFRLAFEEKEYTAGFVIAADKRVAYFDADKLEGDWVVRKWRKGDVFVPFGMTGKKLVSDFLTDRKFSLLQKENQWVLCCGETIAWVIGERADNRFRIDGSTRRVAVVTVIGESV